eukprot:4885456-Karenia_brevis.AAC.1
MERRAANVHRTCSSTAKHTLVTSSSKLRTLGFIRREFCTRRMAFEHNIRHNNWRESEAWLTPTHTTDTTDKTNTTDTTDTTNTIHNQ